MPSRKLTELRHEDRKRTLFAVLGWCVATVVMLQIPLNISDDLVITAILMNIVVCAMACIFWLTSWSPKAWIKEHSDPKYKIGLGNLIFLAILLTIASSVVGTYVAEHYDKAEPAKNLEGATTGTLLFMLVLQVTIAPVIEEFVIRGTLYPVMRRSFSVLASVLTTSVMFALFHGTIRHLVPTFVVGVVLALIYEHTRRLSDIIIMHVVHNLAAVLLSAAPFGQLHPVAVIVIAAMLWSAVAVTTQNLITSPGEDGDHKIKASGGATGKERP